MQFLFSRPYIILLIKFNRLQFSTFRVSNWIQEQLEILNVENKNKLTIINYNNRITHILCCIFI